MHVAAPSVRRRRFASPDHLSPHQYLSIEPESSHRSLTFPSMLPRRFSLFFVLTTVAACQGRSAATTLLPTTAVTRGDIAVRVQATGIVEPINPVDIKSKAGGTV